MTHPFDRRRFMKIGTAVASLSLWLRARAGEAAWRTRTVAPFIEVETTLGRIRGGHSRGALAFKGVPYAGPVSGENRFKAPPKATAGRACAMQPYSVHRPCRARGRPTVSTNRTATKTAWFSMCGPRR